MYYRRLFGTPRFVSPFDELGKMRQMMDRVMDGLAGHSAHTLSAGVFPLINQTEDRDAYHVRAELPGVKSDALDIQVDAKNLVITGERKIDAQGEGVKYHRKEREAGKFSRVIGLPGEVDSDKVDASLVDGVLRVTLPKAEAVKPRQIAIN